MQRPRRRRGASIVEIMAGVYVLGLAIVAASALFPMTAFLRDGSSSYTRAAAITQRKLEQIRDLDPSLLTPTGLRSAGVVDTAYDFGSYAWYSYSTVDRLSTELPAGYGWILVTDTGSDLTQVQTWVSWQGLHGRWNSVYAQTYVADKEIWVEP